MTEVRVKEEPAELSDEGPSSGDEGDLAPARQQVQEPASPPSDNWVEVKIEPLDLPVECVLETTSTTEETSGCKQELTAVELGPQAHGVASCSDDAKKQSVTQPSQTKKRKAVNMKAAKRTSQVKLSTPIILMSDGLTQGPLPDSLLGTPFLMGGRKECPKCSKTFVVQEALDKHVLTHTDERTHECTVCGKKFTTKDYLKRHLGLHTGEFECTKCGKHLSSKYALMEHMRTHLGEKPYKCTVCTKSFTHESTLTKHARIHTGEKPYECTFCQKRFNDKGNLTSHLSIHTGEKPYECTECGLSFIRKFRLTNHMRTHTGEKPFECTACGERFRRRNCLKKHKTLHCRGSQSDSEER